MQNSSYCETLDKQSLSKQSYTDLMQVFYNNLIKNDVDEEIARDLIED